MVNNLIQHLCKVRRIGIWAVERGGGGTGWEWWGCMSNAQENVNVKLKLSIS